MWQYIVTATHGRANNVSFVPVVEREHVWEMFGCVVKLYGVKNDRPRPQRLSINQ